MTGTPRSTEVPYQTVWIPRANIALVPAGVHFDIVRVCGVLGFEVARRLDETTSRRPGPMILEDADNDEAKAYLYCLVAAGDAMPPRRWPPGIRVFGLPEQITRIPSLWGNTYPLRWRSVPTRDVPLVDVDLLHRTLCEITTWTPLPDGG